MSIIQIPAFKGKEATSIDVSDTSRIAFITGAGVSVGSGLPTYYGKNGVYSNLGERPEDVLNAFNMKNNPHLIWNQIKDLIVRGFAAPASISHTRIAEIEKLAGECMIVTQNVDNLHEKGGAETTLHIHGAAEYSYCHACRDIGSNELFHTIDFIDSLDTDKAPKCPTCGEHHIVPDIVPFYGEFNPVIYNKMNAYFHKPVDVCFVTGTQLHFPYIETLLFYIKQLNPNAIIVDINPDVDYINEYAQYNFKETSDNFFNRILIE